MRPEIVTACGSMFGRLMLVLGVDVVDMLWPREGSWVGDVQMIKGECIVAGRYLFALGILWRCLRAV